VFLITYIYIYTARIRPIGYGLGIVRNEEKKKKLNYHVCPINTRIICIKEKEKRAKVRRRRKRTDHNCFIIEVLLYSTYNNNNTCVYMYTLCPSSTLQT
jgi:hypothetical protein